MLFAKLVGSLAFLWCVILLKLFMNPLLNIENMIPRIQHIPDGMRCFINNSLFYRDYKT